MASVDLRLLAPFVALAEELHFGRAAARLHVAQPALSQQIKRLERQLGVPLFERHTRAVQLAPAGHAFLAGARAALKLVEQASQDARRAGRPRAHLRVGVDVDTPTGLARRVRQFGLTRTDLDVRVTVQQQDDLLRELADGRLQLMIGWIGPPADEPGIAWAPLLGVELHGVVAAHDSLAGGDCLPRSALVGHCLAMYEPTRETRPFYEFFLACFTPLDGGATVAVGHIPPFDDAQEAMLNMVDNDGGFTFCLPGELGAGTHPNLVELPFDPPVRADLVAMWLRHQEPQALGNLLSFLRDGDPRSDNAPQ